LPDDKATSWLTLNGGARLTHFVGSLNENSADPRVGAAIRVPRLNWVLRGFYGRYYQAPPLQIISILRRELVRKSNGDESHEQTLPA